MPGSSPDNVQTTRNIKSWMIGGVGVIILVGTLLHYAFEWTGESRFVGAFVPVNESVWEHLKLGYWALTMYSLVEYHFIAKQFYNFIFAKCTGILVLELTILLMHYSYITLMHDFVLWIDISSFAIGVILCQYVTYRMLFYPPLSSSINWLSLVLYVCIGVLLAITTYYPPRYDIFMDHRDQTYGIDRRY